MKTRLAAIAVISVMALTACSGEESERVVNTSTPTETVPHIEPLPEETSIGTKTLPGGTSYTLNSVQRIAPDRVVVQGWFTAGRDPSDMSPHSLDEYPRAAGESTSLEDVSDISLRVSGDQREYLAVRDSNGFCQCTASASEDPDAAWATMTVVTAPADAQTVNLRVGDFGEFANVPITEVGTETRVPFANSQVLEVRKAERVDGAIRVEGDLTLVSDRQPLLLSNLSPLDNIESSACDYVFFAVNSTGETGVGQNESNGACLPWETPSPVGDTESFQSVLADPGGEDVVLLPTTGRAVRIPITGDPPKRSAETKEYLGRYRLSGALIETGGSVEIPTRGMFDGNSTVATPELTAALAATVTALRAQPERSIKVWSYHGDLDYEGTDLLEARATAIRAELARQLGTGWTITVSDRSEFEPRMRQTRIPGSAPEENLAVSERIEIHLGQGVPAKY